MNQAGELDSDGLRELSAIESYGLIDDGFNQLRLERRLHHVGPEDVEELPHRGACMRRSMADRVLQPHLEQVASRETEKGATCSE